jgi:hypothetical protein
VLGDRHLREFHPAGESPAVFLLDRAGILIERSLLILIHQ